MRGVGWSLSSRRGEATTGSGRQRTTSRGSKRQRKAAGRRGKAVKSSGRQRNAADRQWTAADGRPPVGGDGVQQTRPPEHDRASRHLKRHSGTVILLTAPLGFLLNQPLKCEGGAAERKYRPWLRHPYWGHRLLQTRMHTRVSQRAERTTPETTPVFHRFEPLRPARPLLRGPAYQPTKAVTAVHGAVKGSDERPWEK